MRQVGWLKSGLAAKELSIPFWDATNTVLTLQFESWELSIPFWDATYTFKVENVATITYNFQFLSGMRHYEMDGVEYKVIKIFQFLSGMRQNCLCQRRLPAFHSFQFLSGMRQ